MYDKPSDKAVEMAVQSMREYVRHKYATSLGFKKSTSSSYADTTEVERTPYQAQAASEKDSNQDS